MHMFATEFRRVVIGRLSEWQCSAITMAFGAVLLLPPDTYANGPAWNAFRPYIGEPSFGLFMLLFGFARFAVLAINGFWRPTYYLRAVGACLSMAIWVTIVLAFAAGGEVGTWMAVYPLLALFAGVDMFRAMDDAREMELARRASRALGEARHVPHPA